MEEQRIKLYVGDEYVGDCNPITIDKKPNALVEALKEIFSHITEEERLEVMQDYCKYCGTDDSDCQCMNDD